MSHLALLLAASKLASTASPVEPGVEGLDAYVETVMKEWKMPGLALAIVRESKVIDSRGYGVRDADPTRNGRVAAFSGARPRFSRVISIQQPDVHAGWVPGRPCRWLDM